MYLIYSIIPGSLPKTNPISCVPIDKTESEKFKTLLSMILNLVNKINIGDESGPIVDGFTLDSLTKLSEVCQ